MNSQRSADHLNSGDPNPGTPLSLFTTAQWLLAYQ